MKIPSYWGPMTKEDEFKSHRCCIYWKFQWMHNTNLGQTTNLGDNLIYMYPMYDSTFPKPKDLKISTIFLGIMSFLSLPSLYGQPPTIIVICWHLYMLQWHLQFQFQYHLNNHKCKRALIKNCQYTTLNV